MQSKTSPGDESTDTDTDASHPAVTAVDFGDPDPDLERLHVGLTEIDAATRIRDLERRAERHRRVAEHCLERLATLEARVDELADSTGGETDA